MSLQEFINVYTGKANVGNTDANRGECVGLIELWIDNFGFPHIWGNAIDLLDNADRNKYEITYNNPNNFPVAGDIVVFKPNHTGIVVSADINRLKVFEQNNPLGSTPRIIEHSYSQVVGWIRMKQANQPTQPANIEDLVKEYFRRIDTKGIDPSNLESEAIVHQTWWDVSQGKVYMRVEECAQNNKELQIFKDQHQDCDEIKVKYQAFVALGYNTVEDVSKALKKKDDKFEKLTADQIVLERKNEELAGLIAKESKVNYEGMEEGLQTVDVKRKLEQERLEIAKVVGVEGKPTLTKILNQIFLKFELAEKWVQFLEAQNEPEKKSTLEPVKIPLRNFLTILGIIPNKKGGAN